MRSSAEPAGSPGRLLSSILRIYLCLFLVGCAAHRPPVSEIRSMETRLMLGDGPTVFQACVGTLQDLGYTVDVSDTDAGVLTASRATHERSGVITQEPKNPDKKGRPAWQWPLLIVIGVVVILVAVAAWATFHHGDDNDKKADNDGGARSDSAASHRPSSPKHGDAGEKPKHKHHEEPPPPPTYVAEEVAPTPPTHYEYRITLNLHGKGDDGTQVRVSLEGAELEGNQIVRAGPVDDPDFFARFFAALDQSLRYEQEQQPEWQEGAPPSAPVPDTTGRRP
jgi:hypothetical protein